MNGAGFVGQREQERLDQVAVGGCSVPERHAARCTAMDYDEIASIASYLRRSVSRSASVGGCPSVNLSTSRSIIRPP
jgi:hypothetical protein